MLEAFVQEKEQSSEQDVSIDEILTPTEEETTVSLQVQLAQTEEKLLEMQDNFLRARAEMENIRRRAQEDVKKAYKFAVEGFAQAILGVKDSLEMSLKLEADSVDSLKEGVEATLRQLTQALDQNKVVEVMPKVGEKLDPNQHQAISTVPSDQAPNTIVEVLQKGYMLSDRLLRPAIVVVAAPK